jgi:DNA-binding NarL/FixJ family response regulator
VPLRVVLVDDHRLIREGLKSFLTGRGVEVVGEGGNGRDGVRLSRELRPDVLLMDLSMPEMNGLEAKSGAQGYLLKSLDPEQLVGQLEAAARGEAALTPALAAKILTELARTAAAGPDCPGPPPSPASHPAPGAVGTTRQPGQVDGPRGRPALDEIEPLTARERDVLDLVVRGASNREIAEALVVTDNTVKYHLKNILQKLHLHNRAQVVAYALQHGLDRS